MSALLSMHARTSGGSRLSEQKELTVIPWSLSPERVVSTVTPDANRPSTERKESGSINVKPFNWGQTPIRPINWSLTPISRAPEPRPGSH